MAKSVSQEVEELKKKIKECASSAAAFRLSLIYYLDYLQKIVFVDTAYPPVQTDYYQQLVNYGRLKSLFRGLNPNEIHTYDIRWRQWDVKHPFTLPTIPNFVGQVYELSNEPLPPLAEVVGEDFTDLYQGDKNGPLFTVMRKEDSKLVLIGDDDILDAYYIPVLGASYFEAKIGENIPHPKPREDIIVDENYLVVPETIKLYLLSRDIPEEKKREEAKELLAEFDAYGKVVGDNDYLDVLQSVFFTENKSLRLIFKKEPNGNYDVEIRWQVVGGEHTQAGAFLNGDAPYKFSYNLEKQPIQGSIKFLVNQTTLVEQITKDGKFNNPSFKKDSVFDYADGYRLDVTIDETFSHPPRGNLSVKYDCLDESVKKLKFCSFSAKNKVYESLGIDVTYLDPKTITIWKDDQLILSVDGITDDVVDQKHEIIDESDGLVDLENCKIVTYPIEDAQIRIELKDYTNDAFTIKIKSKYFSDWDKWHDNYEKVPIEYEEKEILPSGKKCKYFKLGGNVDKEQVININDEFIVNRPIDFVPVAKVRVLTECIELSQNWDIQNQELDGAFTTTMQEFLDFSGWPNYDNPFFHDDFFKSMVHTSSRTEPTKNPFFPPSMQDHQSPAKFKEVLLVTPPAGFPPFSMFAEGRVMYHAYDIESIYIYNNHHELKWRCENYLERYDNWDEVKDMYTHQNGSGFGHHELYDLYEIERTSRYMLANWTIWRNNFVRDLANSPSDKATFITLYNEIKNNEKYYIDTFALIELIFMSDQDTVSVSQGHPDTVPHVNWYNTRAELVSMLDSANLSKAIDNLAKFMNRDTILANNFKLADTYFRASGYKAVNDWVWDRFTKINDYVCEDTLDDPVDLKDTDVLDHKNRLAILMKDYFPNFGGGDTGIPSAPSLSDGWNEKYRKFPIPELREIFFKMVKAWQLFYEYHRGYIDGSSLTRFREGMASIFYDNMRPIITRPAFVRNNGTGDYNKGWDDGYGGTFNMGRTYGATFTNYHLNKYQFEIDGYTMGMLVVADEGYKKGYTDGMARTEDASYKEGFKKGYDSKCHNIAFIRGLYEGSINADFLKGLTNGCQARDSVDFAMGHQDVQATIEGPTADFMWGFNESSDPVKKEEYEKRLMISHPNEYHDGWNASKKKEQEDISEEYKKGFDSGVLNNFDYKEGFSMGMREDVSPEDYENGVKESNKIFKDGFEAAAPDEYDKGFRDGTLMKDWIEAYNKGNSEGRRDNQIHRDTINHRHMIGDAYSAAMIAYLDTMIQYRERIQRYMDMIKDYDGGLLLKEINDENDKNKLIKWRQDCDDLTSTWETAVDAWIKECGALTKSWEAAVKAWEDSNKAKIAAYEAEKAAWDAVEKNPAPEPTPPTLPPKPTLTLPPKPVLVLPPEPPPTPTPAILTKRPILPSLPPPPPEAPEYTHWVREWSPQVYNQSMDRREIPEGQNYDTWRHPEKDRIDYEREIVRRRHEEDLIEHANMIASMRESSAKIDTARGVYNASINKNQYLKNITVYAQPKPVSYPNPGEHGGVYSKSSDVLREINNTPHPKHDDPPNLWPDVYPDPPVTPPYEYFVAVASPPTPSAYLRFAYDRGYDDGWLLTGPNTEYQNAYSAGNSIPYIPKYHDGFRIEDRITGYNLNNLGTYTKAVREAADHLIYYSSYINNYVIGHAESGRIKILYDAIDELLKKKEGSLRRGMIPLSMIKPAEKAVNEYKDTITKLGGW